MQFTKTPFLISNAGNPMRVVVSGGSSGAIKAKMEIAVTDVDTTSDHTIVVSFMGAERVLTLKSVPTDENHLPVATAGQSVTSWVDALHQRLLHNTALTSYYSISLEPATNVITIEAISEGTEYDITAPSFNVSGIGINPIGAVPPASLAAEAVFLEVRDSAGVLLGEDLKYPDSIGLVRFDVAEYVYAKLLDFTPPHFSLLFNSGSWSKIVSGGVLKYRIGIAAVVNSVKQPWIYDSFRYALGSGLNREMLTYYSMASLDYWSEASNMSRFLSWMPNPKATDTVTPERLVFFFKSPAYAKYAMKVRGYHSGGYFNYTAVPLTSITPYSVVEFCCGFSELLLDGQAPGQTITSYRVWLENENGTVISEDRLFSVDRRYYENIRRFVFRNSMGGYDLVRFTGKTETELESERTKSVFITESVESFYNAPEQVDSVEETQLFKANSGWITLRQLDHLRDMLRSTEIYELAGSQLFKITITGKKAGKKKDQDYNYELVIEYTRAWTDQFYSSSIQDMISIKDNDTGTSVDAAGVTEDTAVNEAVKAGGYMLKTISFQNKTPFSGQISCGSVPGGNDIFSSEAINPLDPTNVVNPEGWTVIRVYKVIRSASASSLFFNTGQEGDHWGGIELDIHIKTEPV
jgi:hypothetical protein